MKDLHNHIDPVQILNPVVISGGAATVDSDSIADRKGAEAMELLANIGESGDTLSGSVKLDVVITHGDLANGSDQAPVDNANDVLTDTFDASTGIFATIDAADEDDAVYKCGYRGNKRYVGASVIKTGTHINGTPVAITAVKGGLHLAPPVTA